MSIEQPKNSVIVDGVQPIAEQTADFVFNHTMLRIKDPAKSLPFYTNVLGMTLLKHKAFDDFSLYFLAKLTEDERNHLPSDPSALEKFVNNSRGILELTHNHGSENDDTTYHSGNSEPKGFGHICFAVPNLADAVAHFDVNKVAFQKRPEEGKMKHIAFIKDPDGYWIEIIER